MTDGTAASRDWPLAGIRVVDFSRILAGPLVTQTLAELGASVIKIEHPHGGDDTRTWGPPFWGDMATYFTSVNKGKQSIALDLRDQEDSGVAAQLVGAADVLVENFRPGVMERLGYSYDQAVAANPGVVYCSISGFGPIGPGADLPGVDLLIQAMAGWMHVTGQPDGPPTKVGMAVVDVIAGLYAAIGILAALTERAATGQGRHVEVSLFESALAGLVNLASGYLLAGSDHFRDGNRHPSIAPYEPVQASDRPFVIAAVNDGLFVRTCEVLDRPDLAADPRFRTNPDRRRNVEALIAELNHSFGERSAAAWIERLGTAGVPAGDINTVGEAFDLAEELGLTAVARSDGDGFVGVRSPIHLSGTASRDLSTPPELDAGRSTLRAKIESGLPPTGWWD